MSQHEQKPAKPASLTPEQVAAAIAESEAEAAAFIAKWGKNASGGPK